MYSVLTNTKCRLSYASTETYSSVYRRSTTIITTQILHRGEVQRSLQHRYYIEEKYNDHYSTDHYIEEKYNDHYSTVITYRRSTTIITAQILHRGEVQRPLQHSHYIEEKYNDHYNTVITQRRSTTTITAQSLQRRSATIITAHSLHTAEVQRSLQHIYYIQEKCNDHYSTYIT